MSNTPRRLPSPVGGNPSAKQLRDAVAELSARGASEVAAVRQAFVSGTPPLRTVSSGSKSDFINRFASGGIPAQIIRSTTHFGLSTAPAVASVPPPRAELDFVEVGTDSSFGVLDSFFSRVVFSISTEDLGRVAYFRVLRAPNGHADVPKPAFSALLDVLPIANKTKSSEHLSNAAFRAGGAGVGNKLTDFVADDQFSSQRAVVNSAPLRPLPPVLNTNRRQGAGGLVSISGADRSVVENVTFYVNRRTLTPVEMITVPLVIGKRQGVNLLGGSTVGTPSTIVSTGNSLGFFEIARVPTKAARRVGLFSEFEYFDPAVVHGASYAYCIVAVTKVGFSGPRTRLVNVDIVRTKPPVAPTVMFGVVSGEPRFSVHCSGSFIDHVEVFRRGGRRPPVVQILSTRRAMIDEGPPAELDSGFFHIGDMGIGADRSNTFVDRAISPGNQLDYRFYTIDSFGLKCSTPFSCSIRIPDVGHVIPLAIPSITAEQAPGGRIVNVIASSDDPRVTNFVLQRRDLTIHENSYRQPTEPDYFTLGVTSVKHSRSRSGPVLNQNSNNAWLGIFHSVSGSIDFIDTSVDFDRVYQYSVFGVDVRGNRTSTVPSRPVRVSIKPVSDAPTSLTGTVSVSSDETPTNVLLKWSVGTQDFSPSDLIGDQDVLFATSQRSVFQVERREFGRSAWQAMPATTASYFIDPVGTGPVPKFRPEFARPNVEYDYRVIAMQSGAFLSTHTSAVRVIVAPEITPPGTVFVRTTPTSIRPLHVVVSWDYTGVFVDSWQVERAVANKVFGSKILSMDSADARLLSYAQLFQATRESSRGHGLSAPRTNLDARVFVGNRFVVDDDVSMANSYFYRVRALDAAGRISDWSYGGIMLTDSPFDRKFLSSLSDKEKADLVLDPRPIPGWRNE